MSRIRLQNLRCRAALVLALAGCLGAGGALRAQEKKPGSPNRPLFPENEVGRLLPKDDAKKQNSGKVERLAPDGPLNGVADLPLFMMPSQQPQKRVPLSREQLEEIDKKKNWMFVDPKTASEDNSADKLLGVRDDRTAEDESKDYKDLMQRHLEKGMSKADPKRKGDSSSEGKSDGETSTENRGGADSFFVLPGDGARFGNKTDPSEVRAFGTKPATATGFLSTPSPGATTGGFNSSTGIGRSSFLPDTSGGAARTDSQREWATEFKQLLDGKAPSTGFGRGSDPTSLLADPSRQSLNPVVGVRPDTYRSTVPTTPSSSFSLPARPAAFDNFNRSSGFTGSPAPGFGAPTLSSPGFNSPGLTPSALPRTGGFQDLPKRKF